MILLTDLHYTITGDSGWQGVQEMNMRMGHAQGVEAYMPNMQHAQVMCLYETFVI